MKMEVTLLPFLLMQIRGTMVVSEIKTKEDQGPKEGKVNVRLVTSLVTMQESALIEVSILGMMRKTT